MKFGEFLTVQRLSEWQNQYFQYDAAKDMIYHFKETAPDEEDENSPNYANAFNKFESAFFSFASRELTKINTFYLEKLNEARRKFHALKSEFEDFNNCQKQLRNHTRRKSLHKLINAKTKDLHDFKIAFGEFYYSVILLQTYRQLNSTAFRKIFKKFDKNLSTTDGAKWREKNVLKAEFSKSKFVEDLKNEIENFVAERLESGDHKRAMKMLKVTPVNSAAENPWAVFRSGLYMGAVLLLIFLNIATLSWANCSADEKGCWRKATFQGNNTDLEDELAQDRDILWLVTIRLFRGTLLSCLLTIMLGTSFYSWRKVGINHCLLFELDVRLKSASAMNLIETGLFVIMLTLGVIWIWLHQFFISYVFDIPLQAFRYFALSYLVFLVIFMINPLKMFMCETRFWLIKSLGRTLAFPFYAYRFADYFLAEQLVSLIPLFQDYSFVACSFMTNFNPNKVRHECYHKLSPLHGFLGCLPFLLRFIQCVRSWATTANCRLQSGSPLNHHVMNAGKYLIGALIILSRSLMIYLDDVTKVSNQNSTSIEIKEDLSKPSLPEILQLVTLIISILLALYWFSIDVVVDWKLIRKPYKCQAPFLRDQTAFRNDRSYAVLSTIDGLILLIYWPMLATDWYSVAGLQISTCEFIITAVFILEALRRSAWNLIRVECEYIFHPVRAYNISQLTMPHALKPLISTDFDDVERMMTLEDGVNDIRKKRMEPDDEDSN